MPENNLTYYCLICITDFTDEGIQPFQCLHILCNDCNKEFSKSSLYYKCPLCKSDSKKDLIDKYILLVKYNGLDLKHIQNQTDEICLMAVKQNGLALKYVKNQTSEICKTAVAQNGDALKYVQKTTDEILHIYLLNIYFNNSF